MVCPRTGGSTRRPRGDHVFGRFPRFAQASMVEWEVAPSGRRRAGHPGPCALDQTPGLRAQSEPPADEALQTGSAGASPARISIPDSFRE